MTRTLDNHTALLTQKELAARLKISMRQVYVLISLDQLPPPFKLGGQNRWREQDVNSYLERLAMAAQGGEAA